MRKALLVASLVVAVLALAGTSSPAYAQENLSRVTVPFEFVAGNNVLPAGSYIIATVVNHPDMLEIRSADGRTGATAYAQVTGSFSRLSDVRITFEKVGPRYFLSAVSVPGCEDRAVLRAKKSAPAQPAA